MSQQLKPDAANDYVLSKMQDKMVQLRELLGTVLAEFEALENRIVYIKKEMGLPVGSYSVRGPDDFFEA